jgi:4-hydroxybutyrate dehydrogenase
MSLIGYATRIHFADRVLEDALPEELHALGVRRPRLVADAAGQAGDAPERLTDALPPGMGLVLDGADAIVALGGPAALDAGRRQARDAGLPVVALPTTTASVGLGPLQDGGTAPVPALILCDATLTMGAGRAATAAAGMDALIHCIEAYLGTAWNPPADGIALEGVRRAGAWLERAVADGQDIEARREMLAAALNAGLAAQKGLGGVHALAHALEAESGLVAHHGQLHAALLPPVIAFNAPAVADRLAPLRQALRLGARADVTAALAGLGRRIGLPDRLAAFGLDAGALDRVAARAAEDPANRTNPRHATAADYRRMLEAAL